MLSFSFKVFWALLYKEVVVFKSDHFRIIMNSLFWTAAFLIPLMYFMPLLGLPNDYARFMLPAEAISWGLFDIMANATSLIGDIKGDRVIENDLTLPLPQWAVFVKIAIANCYKSVAASIFIIPFGMFILYLGKGFTLPHSSLLKTFLMLCVANLCFGFLGLFTASFMEKISDIRNVWMRILFPLWWIGGFNTSWAIIHKAAPTFAYLLLINPIVYMTEGIRAAMLGQEGFLNYWLCIGALLAFTVIFGTIAVLRFQKRLDCI